MSELYTCGKCSKQGPSSEFSRCSRCKSRTYCTQECQVADWKAHKPACKKPGVWYDKYRKCDDGSSHFGKLELITWDCVDEDGEELGWGACYKNESDDLKKSFETEYGGDEQKWFETGDWRQGFRWTCCGMSGDMPYGCDHHGTGPRPCTCDFCRGGKPLPDSIYKEPSSSRKGLTLSRGPDPRSYNPAINMFNEMGRAITGLEF